MAEPIISSAVLLQQATDALEEAYRDRPEVPPALLALIAALRERAAPPVAIVTPSEPDPEASTVTQDEP